MDVGGERGTSRVNESCEMCAGPSLLLAGQVNTIPVELNSFYSETGVIFPVNYLFSSLPRDPFLLTQQCLRVVYR